MEQVRTPAPDHRAPAPKNAATTTTSRRCAGPTVPGAVCHPASGRAPLRVELAGRRASRPVTDTQAGDLGTRPSPGKAAARAAAPLLTENTQKTEKTEGTR